MREIVTVIEKLIELLLKLSESNPTQNLDPESVPKVKKMKIGSNR